LLRGIGIPIEVSGRLVSFSFYLASLWPLWLLFRSLKFGRFAFLAASILFLSSPIYLYWSRTLMIESCALFFAALWLALLADFLTKPRLTILIYAIAAGIAAALVKSTTFPAFLVVGGFLIIAQFLSDKPAASLRKTLFGAVAACIVPVFTGVLWIMYSNSVRAQNPFAAMIVPDRMASWIFGTWAQRASTEFWREVLIRTMPDILGFGVFIAVLPSVAALANRKWRAAFIAAIIAFLTPLALFTNVHLIHSYYRYSNAIFILGAVGLGIGRMAYAGHRWMAAIILATLPVLQLTFFWGEYTPFLVNDYDNVRRVLKISSLIKESTPTTSGLIIIGFDTNSVIPYYSERKSLAIPGWAPSELMQRVFEHPQAFLGENQLAGILFCPDRSPTYIDKMPLIRDFVAYRRVLGEADGCQFLAPNR
jgi:hypothetical protein